MSYTIGDLIKDVLPRVAGIQIENKTSGISLYSAANSVQSLIAKNMVDRHSDLLAKGDLAVVIAALGYYNSLPDDFISLAEKPKSEELLADWMAGTVTSYNSTTGALVVSISNYSGTDSISSWKIATADLPGLPSEIIADSTTTLTPGSGTKNLTITTGLTLVTGTFILIFTDDVPAGLNHITRRLQPNYLLEDDEHDDYEWWSNYGATTFYEPWLWSVHPSRYKIIDSTIYVRPSPVAGITISGKYFKLPTAFTGPTDVIPWNGKFDELFREGVVIILKQGLPVPMADKIFAALFNQEFTMVINSRVRILPESRTRISNFM